ncbi:MAG: HAD family phosphatase [Patescibacteria group bacterium]|nr:HAD family phosphatase [Patescibacteria group bacterium]
MAKYKIVIFDLDGVIFSKPWSSNVEEVAVSSWDVLFKELGMYDLHEKLKRMFIEKRFKSYLDWTEAACCLLKANGLDKKTFEEIIKRRPFITGAKETLKILNQNEIITGIVSGSFEELALRVKKEIGMDYILAHCRLKFNEKTGLLEDWKLFGTDWKDKAKFVKYMADLYKTNLAQCAYIGDDVNDIPVFKKVGLPIAFNAHKKKVKEAAKIVIKKKDLREILPYLGLK